MDSIEEILQEVKVLMLRNNWSVADIANKWGVGESQASRILNGHSSLKVAEHLLPLCKEAGLELTFTPKA
jgi:DNA-binding LacI/PurR family transcriptional regulator